VGVEKGRACAVVTPLPTEQEPQEAFPPSLEIHNAQDTKTQTYLIGKPHPALKRIYLHALRLHVPADVFEQEDERVNRAQRRKGTLVERVQVVLGLG
jgi:hypothetical protein